MLGPAEIQKAILDSSPDGIILISPEHKILSYNVTIKFKLPYFSQRNYEIGGDYMKFINPDHIELYLSCFKRAINGENVIVVAETKSATFSTWFEYRLNPVYTASQKLIGVSIIIKNIDKEKRAEQEFEKLTKTTKAIFENTTESIVIIDKDFVIVSFNKTAFERIKKYGGKELVVGGDFRNFIYKTNDKTFFDRYYKALNGKITTTEVEMIDTNGNPFWVQARHQPIYSEDGKLLGVGIFSQHITEKKLAEREVEKLTETVTNIFDNTNEAIMLISPDFKLLSLNKAMFERTKLHSKKEMYIGADSRDFIYNPKEVFLDMFYRALKGEAVSDEVEVKADDGNRFWLQVRMQPTYRKNGELMGVSYFSLPITEKKLAEIEVEKLSETITNIFDNTNELILLVGPDLKILSFNKAMFERTKERSNKEVFIGADGRDFMYNRPDVFLKMFYKALNGEAIDEEIELKDFKGNKFWIIGRMQPTYRKNGELLGVSFFGTPNTAKKLAEIALQENEEKFKKIVESTPTPIVIADAQMNILLVNSETEEVFGYKSEELLGKSVRILIPKNKPIKKSEGNSELQGSLFYGNELIPKITTVTKNGVPIIIENSVKTFYLNNKKYIVSIILDVTQRVKNEEQIANQIKRLQAIAWQQSHEIRRPLSNILGVFDLLEMQENISAEEIQKYLDYIHQSAKELDQIIHNIVDYTS